MYKYIGEFKNNEFEGKGTAYYVGGETESGIWKKGKLINPTNDDDIIPQKKFDMTTSKGCYEKGKDLRIDNGYEAIKVFEKAYQIGDYPYNLLALWQVGLIYYTGYGGVPANFSKAVEYFRKSYNGGCKEAGYMLGVCYEYGRGVDRNITLSQEYYKQSGYNLSNSPSWDK